MIGHFHLILPEPNMAQTYQFYKATSMDSVEQPGGDDGRGGRGDVKDEVHQGGQQVLSGDHGDQDDGATGRSQASRRDEERGWLGTMECWRRKGRIEPSVATGREWMSEEDKPGVCRSLLEG
jgi:hypothetical protein